MGCRGRAGPSWCSCQVRVCVGICGYCVCVCVRACCAHPYACVCLAIMGDKGPAPAASLGNSGHTAAEQQSSTLAQHCQTTSGASTAAAAATAAASINPGMACPPFRHGRGHAPALPLTGQAAPTSNVALCHVAPCPHTAGMGEITQLLNRLSSIRRFSRGGHWLLPLHSSVSPADQRQAFRVPPKGGWPQRWVAPKVGASQRWVPPKGGWLPKVGASQRWGPACSLGSGLAQISVTCWTRSRTRLTRPGPAAGTQGASKRWCAACNLGPGPACTQHTVMKCVAQRLSLQS